MTDAPAPGFWLRLTALAGTAATLLAVVSGAAGLDTAHRALAALAGLDRLEVPAAVKPLQLPLDADLVAFPVDVHPA